MRSWLPVIIAFACSFLMNRQSYWEETRSFMLFMGGFMCAAAYWSPNFFYGVFDP